MPKPREEYLYILCKDRAYFAPIKTMGPIVQPLKVTKKAVIAMLMSGCHVYEYVLGTHETIKLTLDNIKDDNARHANAGVVKKNPEVNKPVVPEKLEGVKVPNEPKLCEIAEPEKDINPVNQPAEKDTSNDSINPADFKFELNEDGTVNENSINWNIFTNKDERRALRNRINEINAAAKAK